jgi:FkbM family methyltransferase
MIRKILRRIFGLDIVKLSPKQIPPILETQYGFEYSYKNLKIFSHERQCIDGTKKQIFEDEVYHFNTDKTNPLIIDAGANIGLAILYWKDLYPDAEITAFEPSREVFSSLKKNIETNHLKKVNILQKAVSNYEGTAEFTTNEKISGSLILEKGLENNYTVEVVKLSNYLKDKEIDFLKIDIEGEERNVFFEILPYLKNVKNFFIEYHSFIHEKQYLSLILQKLEELNFRYYIEDDFKLKRPLTINYNSLNQDMKLNIWAKNNN